MEGHGEFYRHKKIIVFNGDFYCRRRRCAKNFISANRNKRLRNDLKKFAKRELIMVALMRNLNQIESVQSVA